MMKYQCPVIAVRDIERAKAFYQYILGQEVELDLGKNVSFRDGLALQEDFAWLTGVPADSVLDRPHNMELYFETEAFDAFLERLAAHPEVRQVHPPKRYPWRQRVVRLYDPDGHMVEVGESMEYLARVYVAQGYTVEQTAELIQHPVKFVEDATRAERE